MDATWRAVLRAQSVRLGFGGRGRDPSPSVVVSEALERVRAMLRADQIFPQLAAKVSPPRTKGSARQRRWRSRVRAGAFCVTNEIDVDDIEALCAAGLLPPGVDHSREDVAAAIKQLLKVIAKDRVP